MRVLVVGISGAGKTTLARRLAARDGLAFHEMDALAFGPGWSTSADLEERVRAITEGDGWVFDSYGYPQVRARMWDRADTVVWLDFSRRTTFGRVLRRSLRRTVLRERVFGGNRETLAAWFTADHPAWHSWREHAPRRRAIGRLLAEHPSITSYRFTSPAQAERWLTRSA